jgi:hypothetical protein
MLVVPHLATSTKGQWSMLGPSIRTFRDGPVEIENHIVARLASGASVGSQGCRNANVKSSPENIKRLAMGHCSGI